MKKKPKNRRKKETKEKKGVWFSDWLIINETPSPASSATPCFLPCCHLFSSLSALLIDTSANCGPLKQSILYSRCKAINQLDRATCESTPLKSDTCHEDWLMKNLRCAHRLAFALLLSCAWGARIRSVLVSCSVTDGRGARWSPFPLTFQEALPSKLQPLYFPSILWLLVEQFFALLLLIM